MKPSIINILRLYFIFAIILSACNLPLQSVEKGEILQASYPETLVTVRVTIPQPLSSGESVSIVILDEITGLAFNQQVHILQAEDEIHYSAILNFRIGSVIKYRYIRQGAYTVQEHQPDGLPVRYRLHHVTSQAFIDDIVSRWTDTAYQGATGRIMGTVIDQQTLQPIPGLMVNAGGIQAVTAADGKYLIDGLAPAVHNLVVYSLDGAYQTFEQGALVHPEATTPADISLAPAPLVNVKFVVTLPDPLPQNAQLKFAGNFIQLGNTFADLTGGISSLASRMPVLTSSGEKEYTITLALPAGADLRYKYTLGDGIWNAEQTAEGSFELRQLIIPARNMTVEDQVTSWSAPGPAPVTFIVTAPPVTPNSDNLSIQFNPGFGWLEPVPMWSMGSNQWTYTLFSPLQGLDTLYYRYCRNEQCGSADEANYAGAIATGRELQLSDTPQTQEDVIDAWTWLPALATPATVPNSAIAPRPQGFIAGVALQPAYHPSWLPHMPQAIQYIKQMNANWVILTPTWTYSKQLEPVLKQEVYQDISWNDLIATAQLARQAEINIGVYPRPGFPFTPSEWWQQSIRDYPWWATWFDRYKAFALHHAQFAATTGAGVLILGGEDMLPAVPGNPLSAPGASNLPQDAETWWRDIIQSVRSIYSGPIAWALPYPEGITNPPSFLDMVDFIYLEWDAPLAQSTQVDEIMMTATASEILDQTVLPFLQQNGKAIVLAFTYPSADGAVYGCLTSTDNICLDSRLLARPNRDIPQISLDLDEQSSVYNSILQAINERSWIGGVITQDFYPPAMLQDKSISIHGKPASGILWYWYGRLLGK